MSAANRRTQTPPPRDSQQAPPLQTLKQPLQQQKASAPSNASARGFGAAPSNASARGKALRNSIVDVGREAGRESFGVVVRLTFLIPCTVLFIVAVGLIGSLVTAQFVIEPAFKCSFDVTVETRPIQTCLTSFFKLQPNDIIRCASLAFLVLGLFAVLFFLSGYSDLHCIARFICRPRVCQVPLPVAAVITNLSILMLAGLMTTNLQGTIEQLDGLAAWQKINEQLRALDIDGSSASGPVLRVAIVWCFAWQLYSLSKEDLLISRDQTFAKAFLKLILKLFLQMLMFAALFIAFDVAFSRFNYHAALQELETQKLSLMVKHGSRCDDRMLDSTENSTMCHQFCESVRSLAEQRRAAMMRIRGQHPTGHLSAKVFMKIEKRDDAANKDLYQKFRDKTCARVLQSVTKTNWNADMWAFAFLLISLLLSYYMLLALWSLLDKVIP